MVEIKWDVNVPLELAAPHMATRMFCPSTKVRKWTEFFHQIVNKIFGSIIHQSAYMHSDEFRYTPVCEKHPGTQETYPMLFTCQKALLGCSIWQRKVCVLNGVRFGVEAHSQWKTWSEDWAELQQKKTRKQINDGGRSWICVTKFVLNEISTIKDKG